MNRGKYAIAALLFVSVGLALVAVGYHYFKSARCVEFWGRDTAEVMLQADHCELWTFADDQPQAVPAAEGVHKTFDVTGLPGMLNLRHALVDNSSFDFTTAPPARWRFQYAFRFQQEKRTATIWLSPRDRAAVNDRGQVCRLSDDFAQALEKVISDLLATADAKPAVGK